MSQETEFETQEAEAASQLVQEKVIRRRSRWRVILILLTIVGVIYLPLILMVAESESLGTDRIAYGIRPYIPDWVWGKLYHPVWRWLGYWGAPTDDPFIF